MAVLEVGTTLQEKLVIIQSELKAPKRQFNSFSNYSFRSCEDILTAVKPLLHAEGLTVGLSDELINIGDRYYVKAEAIISDGTEFIKTYAYARECETKKGMDEAQITGSASSYARKYALNGLFAIDDTQDPDHADNRKQAVVSKPTQSVVKDSKYITDAQVKLLLARSRDYSKYDDRQKIIDWFEFTTGKKPNEILKADMDEVLKVIEEARNE